MSRPAERVVAFYNKRGTAEQWIKEGKGAIKWTRLSCRTFAANAVRLQLHALACNLGNFLRTLATPEPIKDWTLSSLKEKLIKIGAKVVSHGRYVAFQVAEVAIPRKIFQEILQLIAELRPKPPPAPAIVEKPEMREHSHQVGGSSGESRLTYVGEGISMHNSTRTIGDALIIRLVVAIAGMGIAFAAPSVAQERYPVNTIKLVVGFPAGGPMDTGARIVMDQLARRLGVPIIVENKPGASGTLAIQQVANASADGYTLGLGITANIAIARYFYPTLPYGDNAIRPILQFAESPLVIYSRKGSNVSTLQDMVRVARAASDKQAYASPGSGTVSHLMFVLLLSKENLSMVHVPFRGSAPAVQAVIQGELDIGVDALTPVVEMVASGKLVALAQSGTDRSSQLPDVPTLSELGYRDLPPSTFLGLFGPAKMSGEIIAKLESEVRQIMSNVGVSDRFKKAGIEPKVLGRDEFEAAITTQLPYWKQAVEVSGVKP